MYLPMSVTRNLGKAVEGYRSPRRFREGRGRWWSARAWSAPVFWRYDGAREMGDAWIFVGNRSTFVAKAVEDYRSPSRFAMVEGAGMSARAWSAP